MDYLFLLSRILFGGYFILNGIGHLKDLNGTAGYAGSKGVLSPKLAVVMTGILLLIGGVGIILGIYVTWAVAALIVFLVPVTFKMHAYWKVTDPSAKMSEHIQFMKNVALIGGTLAYLFVSTPWPFSL